MANHEKKLYRDPSEAAIWGICAGIAEYFDWDLLLVRVAALLLLFVFSAVTLVVYIVLRLVLPAKTVHTTDHHACPTCKH